MTSADRRARFRELHQREGVFVMPNAWDAGSARLLAWCGFDAIATTSAGFAWTLGRPDQSVTRPELLQHVAALADTIARLVAYRTAGADVVYAPGLTDAAQITAIVEAVDAPVNVLALPDAPPVAELGRLGVRRVSTGSALASAAYGALLAGTRELQGPGSSSYARAGLPRDVRDAAFSRPGE